MLGEQKVDGWLEALVDEHRDEFVLNHELLVLSREAVANEAGDRVDRMPVTEPKLADCEPHLRLAVVGVSPQEVLEFDLRLPEVALLEHVLGHVRHGPGGSVVML